jgi:hypothetical protein
MTKYSHPCSSSNAKAIHLVEIRYAGGAHIWVKIKGLAYELALELKDGNGTLDSRHNYLRCKIRPHPNESIRTASLAEMASSLSDEAL